MATPEELLRQTAEESRTRSLAALDQGEAEGKKAALAAQENIKAQQAEAVNRLLADARTRGFSGGADTLQAEMVGPGERRVQSIEQGLGNRGQDYAYRRSILGDLYGRMEALAPALGAQFAASLAGGGGRGGRGGGGGGRGGGGYGGGYDYGGGMPTTQQTDVSEQHTVNEDELYKEQMEYERLMANIEQLDPRAQAFAMDLWRREGGSIPRMQSSMAKFGTKKPELLYDALGPKAGRGWGRPFQDVRRRYQSTARKQAIQAAIDDARRHRTTVTSTTGDKWKWSDRTNTRGKAKGTGFPFRVEGRG